MEKLRIVLIAVATAVLVPLLLHAYVFEPHQRWDEIVDREIAVASNLNDAASRQDLAEFWLVPGLIGFIGAIGIQLRPGHATPSSNRKQPVA